MKRARYLVQGLAHCICSKRGLLVWRCAKQRETNKQTDFPNPLKIISSYYLREKVASPKHRIWLQIQPWAEFNGRWLNCLPEKAAHPGPMAVFRVRRMFIWRPPTLSLLLVGELLQISLPQWPALPAPVPDKEGID